MGIVGLLLTAVVLWAAQDLVAKIKPAAPANLNTASSTELQEVPGIGPAAANKILQARKSYGAFKNVDDLQGIKELGPKRLEKMRKYLTVGKPAQAAKPPAHATDSAQTKGPPPTKSAAKPASLPKTWASREISACQREDEEQ